MNSCQQFEGYQSAGDAKPQLIKQQVNSSRLMDGK